MIKACLKLCISMFLFNVSVQCFCSMFLFDVSVKAAIFLFYFCFFYSSSLQIFFFKNFIALFFQAVDQLFIEICYRSNQNPCFAIPE